MSLQVTELADPGRPFDETSGKLTGERTFVVYDADESVTVNGMMARSAPGIPRRFDFHPNNTLLRVLRAVPKPMVSRANTWKVTVSYGIMEVETVPPDNDEPEEGEPGYIEYNTSVHAEWVDGWRADPRYGFGSGRWLSGQPTRADIGGTDIDSQGEPASYEIRMISLDISETFSTPPPTGVWLRMVNNRNYAGFLDSEAGKTLYKGFDVDRVGAQLWNVTHHFWHDDAYHLRQFPLRAADGKPVIDTDGNAKTVYWVQPYPKMEDFNILGFRL